MPLFDSHLHLQDERIYKNVDPLMRKAFQAGVRGYLCNGSMAEDWEDVLAISRRYPEVVPAFGLHPWYVKKAPADWFDQLKGYLQTVPSVVGETGLDLMFRKKSLDLQLNAFERHMELAAELERPLSLHCLKAWHHLIPLLKQFKGSGIAVQLHAYSGGPEQIDMLAHLGCYFSFTGAITRDNSQKLRASIVRVPKDRLLLETDAPDIPLQIDGNVDKTVPNEPANLLLVHKQAAALLDMDESELATLTWNNTLAFLGDLAQHFPFKDIQPHDSRTV